MEVELLELVRVAGQRIDDGDRIRGWCDTELEGVTCKNRKHAHGSRNLRAYDDPYFLFGL